MKNANTSSKRLLGIDVARSLAIGGMALVHFVMVLSSQSMDGSLLDWFFNRASGRPATMFMILAGIGVSLRFAGKTDAASITRLRKSLTSRGWIFLIVGFVNLVLWPGDILRVYGIAYLCAALLAFSSQWKLLTYAVGVVLVFVGTVFVVDFGTNWNFETLEYANLWTLHGGLMNLFYNGFRAVLPWLGVMFFGMWVGRFDLRSSKVRKTFIVCGLLAWAVAELISFGLIRLAASVVSESELEDLIAILGTDSLPPMPLFLLSSGGFAIAVIMSCVHLCELKPGRLWDTIANAGQLAFTWYILHIFVVIAAGVATDFRGDTSLLMAYVVSATFFVAMCVSSFLYRGRFRHGPLEWTLRKLAR